jgi:tetratricopeptide (TPR) repeat protein/tRNA A-37 threonylcarbamoyl transferase component Bud32
VLHDLAAGLGDRYSVERELGHGGMATVWLAQDLRHDRVVALKVLHSELAGAIGVERFLREVRLTARLQHPNIVPVFDSGTCPVEGAIALPWFAMAYIDGESLRQRIDRERQLPVEQAVKIALAASAALEAAHSSGVVHRDIKPENILLAGDHVYVADFGIAKALVDTSAERITGTGIVVGTPAYMSPEQASNDTVDERSDQYALATVLYQMLTGEAPFTGVSGQAVIARRLTEPARPIRSVRPSVPAALETSVMRALERVPADRFADISRFAAALRDPEPASVAHGRPRIPIRRIAIAALAVVLVAAGGALGARRLRASHRTASPKVLTFYQRGVQAYAKRTPAGAAEALDAFKSAIRLDSTYGPSWAGLAKTYVQAYGRRFVFLGVARDSALHLALTAADRALAADSSADAWLTKGMVDRLVDPTDDAPALRSFRQAVAIDSTLAQAWQQLGNAELETNHADIALEGWRRAVAADPRYTEGLSFLALGHYWRRQYDSAAHWADSAVAVDPAYLLARTTQGSIAIEQGKVGRGAAAFAAADRISTDVEIVNSLAGEALASARAGRREESLAFLARAESLAKAFSPTALHTAVFMAQPYAALGDPAHAAAWLERYKPSADLHFQLHIRCDPPFDPIADHPRFRALLLVPRPTAPKGC